MKILRTKPILVTGSHRSGTTWVGKMLSLAPRVIYIDEIFNPEDGLLQHKKVFDCWFKYLTNNEEGQKYKTIVTNALRFYSKRGAKNRIEYLFCRPLLKDPIAVFSSEWLSKTCDMDIIVLIRHPAAFVSSLKRLNWRFDFDNFLSQPGLMSRYLRLHENMIKQPHSDIIEEASVLWLCIYSVVDEFIKRNPHWAVKRLEDISMQPVEEFRDIYKRLGLIWTKKVKSTIESFSNESNPAESPENRVHHLKRNSRANVKLWKQRLSDQEVNRIMDIVEPLASKYYRPSDW